MIKPGKLFRAEESTCIFREVFNRRESNLDYLSAGEVCIRNADSPAISYPKEEALLFNLAGPVVCIVDGTTYSLDHYDVLYVPTGSAFTLSHTGREEARIYIYRALGEEKYPPFLSKFEDAKVKEDRIRHLNRKIVYKMFDVTEEANKLLAGFTFYDTHTRAWPPHNHRDQEEVYSFIEGEGAMSVYEDDEHQHFVKSVHINDHITIPVMNYHPVFSDETPLCFIWCIAGERYWVGDKNSDFMTGNVSKITT